MALNTRGSVDPRWLYHNNNVGRALELATIEIFSSSNSGRTYNPTTNTWSGGATGLYTGRAKIQQTTSVTETSTSMQYNPTTLQTVRITISEGRNTLSGSNGVVPDIRPNDKIRVTAATYNDDLVKFIFVVTGVLNSSHAWEKTLLCKVDTELDPTVTA